MKGRCVGRPGLYLAATHIKAAISSHDHPVDARLKSFKERPYCALPLPVDFLHLHAGDNRVLKVPDQKLSLEWSKALIGNLNHAAG